jgi:iron complex transport system permease protein
MALTDLVAPVDPDTSVAWIRRLRRVERTRTRRVGVALVLAIVVVSAVSLSVGDLVVPLSDVVPAVLGGGPAEYAFVVRDLRLPRVLAAWFVGAALAMSGAMFQSIARNPLASPDIIGVTAGASAAAVVLLLVVGASAAAVSAGAFVGAAVTAALVYVLAWRSGLSPYRLVLVGIGLGAFLSALTAFLLTRAEVEDLRRATVWLTGSLNATTWSQLTPLVLGVALFGPAALVVGRQLEPLQLGDDTATGLGLRVERVRVVQLALAVGLAAVAVAAAGPVAFVAFVAAPVARRLVRQPLALVPCALVGALLVVAADLVARRLFAPTELPVGVLTGIVGAPYLLWLLARTNRRGASA